MVWSDGYEVLTINVTHTKKLLSLKNIHKDPFDRIIISQALVEKLVIITKDDVFKDYKVKVIW